MSAVDPTAANPFANIGLTQPQGASTTPNGGDNASGALALNAQNFMQLLLAQVQNQSPLNPMDSTAFLGQLAQLSTVSGIQQLNTSFTGLSSALSSSQTLQAASLVGHKAQVTSGNVRWDGTHAVQGSVVLPAASGNVAVAVTDASGALIKTIPLGSLPVGTASYTWDGTGADGKPVPAGTYHVIGAATDNGTTTALQTRTTSTIESVGVGGSNGLTLDLEGIGSVSINDIHSIQ